MKELHSDILIIGGGLTGLMTAYALSPLKKTLLLLINLILGSQRMPMLICAQQQLPRAQKYFLKKLIFGPSSLNMPNP